MSDKLSERLKEIKIFESEWAINRTEIIQEIEALESKLVELQDKADNWDTFYGHELHPNPVVQAECDRIENKELKDKLAEVEDKIKNALKIIDEAPFAGTFIIELKKALEGIETQ